MNIFIKKFLLKYIIKFNEAMKFFNNNKFYNGFIKGK